MYDLRTFRKLQDKGLISNDSFRKIESAKSNPSISLYWELTSALYLGVLLLSTGLGVLIYKNIDSIGHTAIVISIALLSLGCFVYCFKNKAGFSKLKVESPNVFFDYVLLLGCLLFVSFIAYLQYQYNAFGERYGLATFVPLCVLFFSAYYFDHLGVLSLGITNFAAWLGISITPLHFFESPDFDNGRVIITGFVIAVFLLLMGYISKLRQFKPHFEFTYRNIGIHVLYVTSLAAIMNYDQVALLLFIPFIALVLYDARRSFKEYSFYFLLVSLLYGYIGLSYMLIELLSRMGFSIEQLYLIIFYFIGSSIGLAKLLMHCNKKMKAQ